MALVEMKYGKARSFRFSETKKLGEKATEACALQEYGETKQNVMRMADRDRDVDTAKLSGNFGSIGLVRRWDDLKRRPKTRRAR